MKILSLIILFYKVNGRTVDPLKVEFCTKLLCDSKDNNIVCGMRAEGKGFRLKVFPNECSLMKHGCTVDDHEAYGKVKLKYCQQSFPEYFNNVFQDQLYAKNISNLHKCNVTCDKDVETEVCGIRQVDDNGFNTRLFQNECQMLRYNCNNNVRFTKTDFYICNGLERSWLANRQNNIEIANNIIEESTHKPDILTVLIEKNGNTLSDSTADTTSHPAGNLENRKTHKKIIVMDESFLDYDGNINDTLDNFFAATHVFDLPLKDVTKEMNETTRRFLIKIAGPVMVFKPWIHIPKNISTDFMHQPTLSSCYHKCPITCPDTYAPVCGVPGISAREPSLMFKNHCFMDAAQCKMRWEDKSDTSESSSYIESSFMICLGDSLNGLYRFLPLVRTLQHMGRLKRKGQFHYKLKNMKFFNQLIARDPKLMG